MTGADRRHMSHALALGRRGMGNTWPNPAVGCVLVRDGVIVGRGWTQPGGRPHAETQALDMAGSQAKGATAYVTLEPCAHTGKTPPCAQALIDAGVARVVAALPDKDPRVSGAGFAMLRRAGIKVDTGICAETAARDHAGFLLRVTQDRPWVTLKLATSFDGRIGTATGESRWITGPQARHHVHAMRLTHDAVMVGGGTARADDPALTVRGFGPVRQPVRVVLSRHLDIPRDGILASTARETPVWLCHGPNTPADTLEFWKKAGARLFETPIDNGQLSPAAALRALAGAGLTRVFCEGGSALAASLLSAGLVDELIGFTAGLALGAEGRPALGAMGLDALTQAPRFDLAEVIPCGPDILHRWHPRRPA